MELLAFLNFLRGMETPALEEVPLFRVSLPKLP